VRGVHAAERPVADTSRKFAQCDMPAERFVLDASVAVEWFLPGGGPGFRYASGILERIGKGELAPLVPDLWHYELGSVLIAAKRDKRVSAAKLRASQHLIRRLQPETLAIEIDAATVVDISQRYHLQGYDAVYFELARRLARPIASLDDGIRTAMQGVRLGAAVGTVCLARSSVKGVDSPLMKRAITLKSPRITLNKRIDPDNPPWSEKMLGPPVIGRGRGPQKAPTKAAHNRPPGRRRHCFFQSAGAWLSNPHKRGTTQGRVERSDSRFKANAYPARRMTRRIA